MIDPDLLKRKKINIGCGHDYRDDYLNIDVDENCNNDLIIADHNLSILPQRHYDEVLAHDVLEHIPHKYTAKALLDWAWLLKKDGILVLQTSYIYGIIGVMNDDPNFVTEFNWMRCLFGNQAHPGDFHHYGFTRNTLSTFLMAAGFEIPSFTIKDRWLIGCEVKKAVDLRDNMDDLGSSSDFASAAWEMVLKRKIEDHTRASLETQCSTEAGRLELLRSLICSDENMYKTAERIGR